jgi:hypothetical protein
MVQRLTALSRSFSGADRLWATWRNGYRDRTAGTTAEHYDAFADNLDLPYCSTQWSAEQEGLWADPVPGQEERARLQLNTMRLRKSIEVRRTRQMGGHLPSAARSNSYPVLFSSYLSGDATARQWAEDVMAQALTDAEEAAWQAHRAMLERSGGHLRVITAERSDQEEEAGSRDALNSAPGQQDAVKDFPPRFIERNRPAIERPGGRDAPREENERTKRRKEASRDQQPAGRQLHGDGAQQEQHGVGLQDHEDVVVEPLQPQPQWQQQCRVPHEAKANVSR